MSDDAFWLEARRRYLQSDPDKVNLNAGTLSPTPIPVQEAVNGLRRRMIQNPSDFLWRQSPPLLDRSRARLAHYLNCRPADLLLLPNITFGVNLITSSLRLRPGSEILTTDHEYGAMIFAWQRLAKRDGLRLRQLELPYRTEAPDEIVAAFQRAIGDETRVLFFSHVSSTTGLVLPAKQLCKLARQRGLLSVVDGAHAPGMIPLDMHDLGADFYAANCHKWLMAPAGAGFMHVAAHRKSMLAPIITSWGYDYDATKSDQDSSHGGTFWQRDMEFHGTTDRCPQMVLPECLDLRQSLGGDSAVLKRTWQLSDYLRQKLAACGLACATPKNESLNGGAMTAFDFPCDDVIAMRDRFWNEFRIECPVTRAAGKTFLRVSTGWFNTTEELDRLADAVRAIRRSP
jgi:isopenicillin-N epimerase